MSGIPASLAGAPWEIAELSPGVYRGKPEVTHRYFEEKDGRFGVSFSISGLPDPALFQERNGIRQGMAPLHYLLSLKGRNGSDLRLSVDQELATSLHPVLQMISAKFDLSKRENQQFAFEWEIELQLLDRDNPVDFAASAFLDKLELRPSSGELAVEMIDVHFNSARHSLILKIASLENWPLDRINDRKMVDYNLTGELALPIIRGVANTIRPLRVVVAVPTIEVPVVPEVPDAVVPSVTPLLPTPQSGTPKGDY